MSLHVYLNVEIKNHDNNFECFRVFKSLSRNLKCVGEVGLFVLNVEIKGHPTLTQQHIEKKARSINNIHITSRDYIHRTSVYREITIR